MPYVAFVAAADYRRGSHLPLSAVTIKSNIQHLPSSRFHKPLIHMGLNKTELNGTTFALIFHKACRVKAMGQRLFR